MTLSKSPSFAGTLSVIFYNEVILPSIQRRKIWHRAAQAEKQLQRAQELPLQPPDAFSQGHKHSITPCCTFVNVIPTQSAC